MEVKIAKIEERLLRCERDVCVLYDKFGALSGMLLTLTKVSDKVDVLESDLAEIKSDIKGLSGLPARRWNSAVDTVIKVTLGALVSYALIRAGIG